jgi:hypothetical protein
MTTQPATHSRRADGWRPASVDPTAGPAALDGVQVGEDVRLEVSLGPRTATGAQAFRCYLASELGQPVEPVLLGLQSSGRLPAECWVEVLEYRHILGMPDGSTVEVPEGIERLIFGALATLVPPGGHLSVEYDSAHRATTARALEGGVPPVATPLGATLRAAGVGDAFRDRYTAGGGREGPRTLQGIRAVDEAHARARGIEMLGALRAFLAGSADLDWGLQARTRPLAQAAVAELEAQFEAGG